MTVAQLQALEIKAGSDKVISPKELSGTPFKMWIQKQVFHLCDFASVCKLYGFLLGDTSLPTYYY